MNDLRSPLLDEHQAAGYLHIAVATLRRWRWAGKPPPFVKIGGRRLYERSTLDDLIARNRCNSTSDPGPEAA